MSQIVNDGTYKAGTLYRIALKNFVTYKTVELFPGPSLNLIIGPNGTGKSTFVCAIILGLCGKTSAIGRALKISEYIRSGCDQGLIEIELYQGSGKCNVIITRRLHLNDTSTWMLDGKTVKEAEVQRLVTSLNIQVDNFCQLLPQDKVQEFSKLTPQKLLRSTLMAAGETRSVDQLDEMIKWRTEHKTLASKLQNNAQVLEEQKRLNESLRNIIDAMRQRRQIEYELEIAEKKKLFLEYEIEKAKFDECKKDREEAVKLVQSHKIKIAPLQQVIDNARSRISELEQAKITTNRSTMEHKDTITRKLHSIKEQQLKLKEVEDKFQALMERYKNRKEEIVEAKAVLNKLEVDRHKLVEKVGDKKKVDAELATLHNSIQKTNVAVASLKKEQYQLQYNLNHEVKPKIRMYQNQIRQLQNMDEKRENLLRDQFPECYRAVKWLREHRDRFTQGAVCEPMMLKINFTDPNFARYLESRVARRDLLAFTFESAHDMNEFTKQMRSMNLKRNVNAVCSPPTRQQFNSQDIRNLSYLGFYTYLSDTISAPDPILRYLCKMYNIHQIPIGNDHTYQNSGKVPSDIKLFFTENHRFSVKVSAYSGKKTSSTIEIGPADMLANTVDVEQLDALAEHLTQLETTEQDQQSQIQDIDNKVSTLEMSLNQLIKQRNLINEDFEKVHALERKIQMQKRKIADIQNEPTLDIEREKKKRDQGRKSCVNVQTKLHGELVDATAVLHRVNVDLVAYQEQLKLSRQAIVQQESEFRELQHDLRSAETTLSNITEAFKRAHTNAKQKLAAATQSCNNKLPKTPGFPYDEEFAELPNDLASLQERMAELQARVAFMDQGDESVVRQYEERQRLIANLTEELRNSGGVSATLDERIKNTLADWMPRVETLLSKVNTTFGKIFERISCVGEIKLDKGDTDDQVEALGVCVLVSYRAGQRLQRLSRQQQSGGERAVATAVYLMSLQALTTVPFRCVDEINQGMDAINERLMIQLFMKVTTRTNCTQYFLLTPKLLKDLQYNEKVMIHTIMNGRAIMDYRKWNIDSFIQCARQ